MGELHQLDVGCADCSVIRSESTTILVDTHGIGEHAHLLPRSKIVKAVFITHQHYDHFDGLGYLKDNGYTIDYFIYSPYDRRRNDASVEYQEWQDFISYRDHFQGQGSTRIMREGLQKCMYECLHLW